MSLAAADTLSVSAIAAALGPLAVRFDVDVLATCDSTNTELMRRAESQAPSGSVVVAERQSAGRGRMGRTWLSEPGASLTFSLLWRFAPGALPHGLSLAVGVALAEALEGMGVAGLALKWPNDLLRDGRKLAGVLVELVPGAPHAAVIGIGVNLRLPQAMPAAVRTAAAALDRDVARNELLARLLVDLQDVLTEFAAGGFVALRQRWLARCAHIDSAVRILSEFAPPLDGYCIGVDVDGALQIETAACIQRILSGEVSLRPA
ncbi:MAG: biotin--[acetyl-CoA-carboxylase] ligase [Rhodocyclales bacterium GWA2_65_20]|nr:MAG: biotin--[acetyl-CoA-carboxylase] ligase [Rhodocyclales bacterium GWA2_65_20]